MSNFFVNLYIKLVADRWGLGFIEEPIEDVINGKPYTIRYVTGIPKDRWYADPFILDYNEDVIELLVEEWRYKLHKGRIAKLTIARNNYVLIDETIILDLETHLSFPFIWRKDEAVYVCPENGESGTWNRYEYDRALNKLINKQTIAPLPLTDATITDFYGDDLIFSTSLPKASGNILTVYSLEGEVLQTITFDNKVARGAGAWLSIQGKVVRPAQDCNGGYGKAVVLQEVTHKDDGSFFFKDIFTIKSTNPSFQRGCHTLNSYKNLTVVDVFGYKRRILGPLSDTIYAIIKRIVKH